MTPSINVLPIFGATVASMIVGFLWYSPMLFGKIWMKLSHMTEEDMKRAKEKGMGATYTALFLTVLLKAYVLAHFLWYMQIDTFAGAAQLAFWAWLGFIATVQLSSVFFERKPVKLYFINVLQEFVVLVVMAVVIVWWK